MDSNILAIVITDQGTSKGPYLCSITMQDENNQILKGYKKDFVIEIN
jgi:hypothetical protein